VSSVETEWSLLPSTYTVLDSHSDKSIVVGIDDHTQIFVALALAISSTMYPDKDWKVGSILRRIDTEKEAVLVACIIETGWSIAARV